MPVSCCCFLPGNRSCGAGAGLMALPLVSFYAGFGRIFRLVGVALLLHFLVVKNRFSLDYDAVLSDSCAGLYFVRRWRAAATPCGQEAKEFFHRFATTRTGYGMGGLGRRGDGWCGADVQGLPRVEGDAFAFVLCRGMTKPKVAHGTQSFGQDVVQVAFDEFAAL